MTSSASAPAPRRPLNWRLLVRQLHWMSAALCFCALIFYAVSGFALNNQTLLPEAAEQAAQVALPPGAVAAVKALKKGQTLPPALAQLAPAFPDARTCALKPNKGALVCDVSRTGRDIRLVFDPKAATMATSVRDRGAWGIVFDLHRGKRVPLSWRLLIDTVAVGFAVFGLTGFVLLVLAARRQAMTWPLVAGGVVVPAGLLLAVLHMV